MRQDEEKEAWIKEPGPRVHLPPQAGLAVPEPQRTLSGSLASLETGVDRTDPGITNIVRLLKFIPGKTFYEIGQSKLSPAC